jgi:hypothetical protein
VLVVGVSGATGFVRVSQPSDGGLVPKMNAQRALLSGLAAFSFARWLRTSSETESERSNATSNTY